MSKVYQKIHYLIWLFSLIAFMAISVITFYIHKDTEEKIDDQFSKTQVILAQFVADKIDSNIEILTAELESVTQNPDIINMDISNMPYFIKNNINEIMYLGFIHNLIFVNENGKIVYKFPLDTDENTVKDEYDFSIMEKYKSTLLSGQPIISDIYKLRNKKKIAASLFMPLFSKNKEYKGAIGALVDLSKIRKKYLDKIETQRSYDLFIINDNGQTIDAVSKNMTGFHFFDNNELELKYDNHSAFIDKVLSEKENTISFNFKTTTPNNITISIKKFAVFTSFSIVNTTWYVIVTVPYEEITFLVQKNFQYISIILAVMLLFILTISYILFELNRKRIQAEEAELHFRTENNLKHELSISEEKYKKVMEEALEGIALFKGIELVEVNNTWANMFGMKETECVGLSIYDIIHFESIDLVKNFFMSEDSQTSDKMPLNYDVSVITRKGEKRIHNISMSKLSSVEKMVCMVMRDVTEKRNEEKSLNEAKVHLEEANKELDFYINSIVHDIKNPLVAVQGFINIITAEFCDGPDEKKDKYLSRIHHNISHIFNLLESLLELSKIGRVKKQIKRIDMDKELVKIKNYLNVLIEEKNVTIIKKDHLPIVYTDETLLTQILVNLISNAIKFSSNDIPPVIEIGANDTENFIQIYVKDNGIGIDKKYHDLIFKAFGRIPSQENIQGSGVGLNIVKKAVKEIGGDLTFESEFGKGTTFYFTIPRDRNYFYLQKLNDLKKNIVK